MSPAQIEPIVPATPDSIDKTVAILSAFSAERGYRFDQIEFAIALTIDGQQIGGLIGDTVWNWLHVSVLAVATEHRGRGYGRALMERAEGMARERGCVGTWVDT